MPKVNHGKRGYLTSYFSDPLLINKNYQDTRHKNNMSSSSLALALAEILLMAWVFYSSFRRLVSIFTSSQFLSKWRLSPELGADIACKTISACFAIACSTFGIIVFLTWDLQQTYVGPTMGHCYLLGMAYFLYDTLAMYQVQRFKKPELRLVDFIKGNPVMALHHLGISLVVIPMLMNVDHEPGEMLIAAALVMESSTPFVSLRAILAHLGQRNGFLYKVNGCAMVVVFFLCRILLYPAFFLKYSKVRNMGYWESITSVPYYCKFVLILVLIMQIYWWTIMIKGAIKVLKSKES